MRVFLRFVNAVQQGQTGGNDNQTTFYSNENEGSFSIVTCFEQNYSDGLPVP